MLQRARNKQSCYNFCEAGMSGKAAMPEKAKMSDEHSKHVQMRTCLTRSLQEDDELKALARSESWEDT